MATYYFHSFFWYMKNVVKNSDDFTNLIKFQGLIIEGFDGTKSGLHPPLEICSLRPPFAKGGIVGQSP
jgi:hypothetical protein